MRPLLDTEDTIVAIASGSEPAIRGVIRLSGWDARRIAAKAGIDLPEGAGGRTRPWVGGCQLAPFDSLPKISLQVQWWPTTRSYCGQPTAELHLVGSIPLLERTVARLIACGARAARPGEFTLRAFLAGKIDLTQAEAVLAVIDAKDTPQLQQGLEQLAGGLAAPLRSLRSQLLDTLADLEAGLDFVDEDIEFISRATLRTRLVDSRAKVAMLIVQVQQRGSSRQRPRVVLAGRPNAGKSRLLNALCAGSHAIVSDVAGTTRDVLSANWYIGPMVVELTDTAGLDGPRDSIEATAQRLAIEQYRSADLILHCVDLWTDEESNGPSDRMPWPDVEEGVDMCIAPSVARIVVGTKADLRSGWPIPDGVDVVVSAVTGAGLDQLRRDVLQRLQPTLEVHAAVPSTALRCRESLHAVSASLDQAIAMIDAGDGEEHLAAEVRLVLHHVGLVTGEVATDDLLDRIFSRFCIGK
jgi:tRNA modification GTPase